MSTPTQDTDDVRVISARLYADDPDALFALVAEHSLDFGCRPSAHRDERSGSTHRRSCLPESSRS